MNYFNINSHSSYRDRIKSNISDKRKFLKAGKVLVLSLLLLVPLIILGVYFSFRTTKEVKDDSTEELLLYLLISVNEPQTYMVEMRDGIKLATDVYLPQGNGPFPAVLYRTPYGKSYDNNILSLLDAGIACVIQDQRGRYASQGNFSLFGTDGQDANDTVEWMTNQSWFNGNYGTLGGSADGITQYMQIPYLDNIQCQFIEVATPNLYEHASFQGGAPRRMLMKNWLEGIGEEHLYEMLFDYPNNTAEWVRDRVINEWEWANVTWPSIHVGGFYDCFCQGILDGYTGYQYKGGPGGKDNAKLILGPWTHNLWDPSPGDLTFPDASEDPWTYTIYAAMFGEKLLNTMELGDYRDMPNVTYYVMGDTETTSEDWNRWATATEWPVPYSNETYYFRDNHTLSTEPQMENANFSYIFNPSDPVETIGGANLLANQGPRDQTPVESRDDVLLFDYNVTEEPVNITGRVWANLFVTSNCTDTDFTIKLCDVYPDGRSMLVCDGIIRARYREGQHKETLMDGSANTIYELWVDLWSTSYVFNEGHRIRVAISSSNYPRFDVNPNTGAQIEPFEEGDSYNCANNTLILSSTNKSSIIFPIPDSQPDFV
jgi:hypothetical protein